MNRSPTVPRTPLGERITSARSASLQAQDPLTWHLCYYWLNLCTIGILLGKHAHIMAAVVKEQHERIADRALKDQIDQIGGLPTEK